ncbi:glycoside hydrolase superfamily [Fomitopsis serialis]|uniref:glycoside hydrolase superfamily n=1 Tax=Fomitopsis serialis TaxID=139415 RepID=UPI002007F654|nr:glycoside hydrolase superfamily [Neoantrodia serialis]KAH9919683.1 glycoside hydrolase superfamily [Neoantrodia serialis]
MRIPFLTSSDRKSTGSRKAAPKQKRATTPIAAAYYPDWSSDSVPPSSLDFSKFDVLLFAFATPNSSNGISWDDGSTSTLKSLVSAAHNSGHGTKVVLSIGGWSGSQSFSQVMKDANRGTFVKACVDAVNKYISMGLTSTGLEYPNEDGAGNPHSSSDAANLLSFFTSLRSAIGSDKIISAAVTDLPWTGSDGNPLKDVSAYADQMTYANIMNYDIFAMDRRRFPANQLMLGLPLYGYVSKSTKTSLTDGTLQHTNGSDLEAYREEVLGLAGKSYAAAQAPADLDEADKAGEPVYMASGDLSSYYGQQIAFSDLISSGVLKEASGTFSAANGYTYALDNCSDTPFIYDTSRKTVVLTTTHRRSPTKPIREELWARRRFHLVLDQDYNYALQNAIRSGLGL